LLFFKEWLGLFIFRIIEFVRALSRHKIQYFKQRAEEEARKSSHNMYVEFEGLEDEECVSPLELQQIQMTGTQQLNTH